MSIPIDDSTNESLTQNVEVLWLMLKLCHRLNRALQKVYQTEVRTRATTFGAILAWTALLHS